MVILYPTSLFLGWDWNALTSSSFHFQDFNHAVQMHSSLLRRLSLERELEVIKGIIIRLTKFYLPISIFFSWVMYMKFVASKKFIRAYILGLGTWIGERNEVHVNLK